MIHIRLRNIKCITLALCILLLSAPALQAAPFVYVANAGDTTVSVIDAANNMVIATVDLGFPPNNDGVAITPDGKTVYVSTATHVDNFVVRIDVATNTTILPNIQMSGNPDSIAIAPNGLFAYVTCNDGTINRITLATNAVDVIGGGLSNPGDITIAPNGLTAYVCDLGLMAIVPVNLITNTILLANQVSIYDEPYGIKVTPDNAYAYVCSFNNGQVIQLNLANPLAPTITNTIIIPIPLGGASPASPRGIALTADGNTMYVTDFKFQNHTVTPINISNPASLSTGTQVTVGFDPWVIAITPDGTSAYVSNNGTSNPGTVTELDITTRLAPTVKTTVDIGNIPAGLAITPMNLLPPSSVSGCKTQNVFFLQTDYINNITWTAPATGSPVAYNIYRDATLTELVATVPASGTLQYYDHGRNPSVIYSYYITSVDSSGNQSMAASVTVTNPC